MYREEYILLLTLALVAGLVGGVISSQFLMSQPVFAEKKAVRQKVAEAEEFRLVDKSGRTLAALRLSREPKQPELVLFASTDPDYKTVLSPGMLWLQDGDVVRRYISIHSGLHQIREGYGIAELDVDGLKLFDRRKERQLTRLSLGFEKYDPSRCWAVDMTDKQGNVIWQAP
ncbi:MAG: hypothetical protein ACFFCW_24810 [Candidatus Hodarchaeota archaeon]